MKAKMLLVPAALFCVALLFAGCPETPQEDIGVGTITIYNIPVTMNDGETKTDAQKKAFKVYINATDSMSDQVLHKAQGTVQFNKLQTGEKATLKDGKWEITMPLYKPKKTSASEPLNPDAHGDPWHGEANFFSIVLTPQNVTSGVEAIWVKAGYTLNDSKARLNWEDKDLMDFRILIGNAAYDYLDFTSKRKALFDSIVCKDTELTRP